MLSRCASFETLKSLKEFKHIHIKVSNELAKENAKSFNENVRLRCDLLCETLNCNVYTAREIIAKNKKIAQLPESNFSLNAKFIKAYFKISDIIECPCLLTLQPSVLQHRYFSLKELGFFSVTPYFILRFTSILKETPQALKNKGFPLNCEHKSEILTKYLSNSNRTEINEKLLHMYKDGSDLRKIRELMNAEYIAAKFECSLGVSYYMLRRCSSLRVQSILNTEQLLNVLLYKFGFSLSKIQGSSSSLMSVHYEAAEQILSEFPEIYGVNTMLLVRKVPQLLKQESKTIHKLEAVLQDFSITTGQLICCPKALSIAPNTIQKRLTALNSIEDLAVLKSNKKFLWLVYNFNHLNSRLNQLKAENMPCSINMFTVSNNTFEKYLLYNNTRICAREVYVYLAEIFELNETEIFGRLNHCSHIKSDDKNFSILNCRRVIEYLLLLGVSKMQLLNALEIVLYDIDTVKMYFNCLKTHPQCQPYEEWVSHYNLIHLLIYIIEVNKYHTYSEEAHEQDDFILECSN